MRAMKKILLVEDDRKISELLTAYLEKEGYEVIRAFEGKEALEKFEEEKPDLILLDLMLPEVDGFSITREVRKKSEVPIIMLTAKVEEVDKVLGLELGADDYITKPFSPREVVARVKAVLRRYEKRGKEEAEVISFPSLKIDLSRHEVFVRGKMVKLTPSEFDILVKMAKQKGRVFTRRQLLEAFQDFAYEGYERTVDAHIKNLRKKIEEDPSKPKYIKTVYGIGYKFEVPHED
jgi:DNA-binding response OmpR family regulator